MFHLHPQKRGKTSKMSTSTISYHSISAQQFFSRALLEVMCAGRRRGAAKALKNPTFSFITSSHSKTISSYYPHSRGSSVLQRCTTTLYRQRGEGSFILRTLYPRYIKQNQRRHLHTICVSCLRSWDRNSVHPVWKKGCFDFLNFCRRGGRVVVVVGGDWRMEREGDEEQNYFQSFFYRSFSFVILSPVPLLLIQLCWEDVTN